MQFHLWDSGKKKINQSNQANSGLTFSLSEYKKDVLLKFWIWSPHFKQSATCLCWKCTGIAIKLSLGLFPKGQWQTWIFKPYNWSWVKPFEFCKPFPQIGFTIINDQNKSSSFHPSLGMTFQINGQNSGWLYGRLLSLSQGHWW